MFRTRRTRRLWSWRPCPVPLSCLGEDLNLNPPLVVFRTRRTRRLWSWRPCPVPLSWRWRSRGPTPSTSSASASRTAWSVYIFSQFWKTSHFLAVLRIRDVYPGSWFLPIPDPGSKNSNKREGWKKICCHTFFVATNFTNLKIILFLKCWRKNLGQFSNNYRTFYSKYCHYA